MKAETETAKQNLETKAAEAEQLKQELEEVQAGSWHSCILSRMQLNRNCSRLI
ncbi:MAG: hypothetical protein ACLUD2_18975 [Clostridium sp.]